MVTLNLRGRLVYALLPTNVSVNARTTGDASSSSLGVNPATGQPTTLRMLSIPVWSVSRPTPRSWSRIAGTSPIRIQRSWTCCRVVMSANPRSEEHTSELQSHSDLVCRLLLEKKKQYNHFQRDA